MAIILNDEQCLMWIKDPSISPYVKEYLYSIDDSDTSPYKRFQNKQILFDENDKTPTLFINKVKDVCFINSLLRQKIVDKIKEYKRDKIPRLYTLNDKWKYDNEGMENPEFANIDYTIPYFTEEECKRWVSNHLINPRTNVSIKQNSRIYIELLYTTMQYEIDIQIIENDIRKTSRKQSGRKDNENTLHIINGITDRLKFMRKNDAEFLTHDIKAFDKLLESKYTDKYYSELLSKKSRKEVIKELLNIVKEDKNYNSRDSRELQIIIESIDVYSRQSIKNWYSNNLSYEKYNYVNDISNNIKEEGNELIFTQYLVSEKIPEKIIRDRDYSPNNYVKNTKIDFYEFKDNKDGSKSSDNIIIPENWKGAEKVLTRKWTKYKKKVWSKLRYMESNYTDKNIIDLFGFFIKYNKNKINNIITFDDIIEYTYKEYYDIITDNSADYKNEISILFKDPHFKTIYINTMNSINKTNKTFKTTKIFLDDYLYKSSVAERVNILNRIKKDESIKYYGDITLKQIATYLNINIIIIHHRVDYGKANDISKRAGSKDLKISMNFYNAGDNNNREELLKRPLIILYKKVDKSFVSYYLIKNTEDNTIIYNELNNANEDIKNIINHPDSKNKSSTPITINI